MPIDPGRTIAPMRSLLTGLGVPAAKADTLASELRARYEQGHRRYHTVEHISEVLAEADRLGSGTLTAAESTLVRVAIWYHDAIYDPAAGPQGNEDASADLARADLRAAGLDEASVEEVARLVRLTATHDAAGPDRPGQVLIDADLSILAADPDRYDRYVEDVRAEYRGVADGAWRAGRAAVLHRFLDAGEIYRVGPDRAQRERAARANLGRELAALTAPVADAAHGTAGAEAPTRADAGPAPAG